MIPGSLDAHDEKLIRAAEDYRQAEGALEDARTEMKEAEAHIIELMRKRSTPSYSDPDGTKITINETKAKYKVTIEKVIPARESVPAKGRAQESTSTDPTADPNETKPSDGAQDENGYAPLSEASKRPASVEGA